MKRRLTVSALLIMLTLVTSLIASGCARTTDPEIMVTIFDITYIVDGEEYDKARVNKGNTATQPTAPQKDGYTFSGWYAELNPNGTGKGTAFNFNTPIVQSLTFYAGFNEQAQQTANVVFKNGNQTLEQKTIPLGGVVTPASTPTKQYHTFGGWYVELNADGTGKGAAFNFSTAITANLTLYAGFNPIPATVTYKVGTQTFNTQNVNQGVAVSAPTPAPTKQYHTFAGWYLELNSDGTGKGTAFDFTTIIDQDLVLYASFIRNQATVTFIAGGETFDEQTIDAGTAITFPETEPEKDNYTFDGWYVELNADGTGKGGTYQESQIVEASFTLYAGFTSNDVLYATVTFMANGVEVDSQVIDKGLTVSAPTPAPTKQYHTFAGWFKALNSDGTGKGDAFDFDSAVNGALTLYAGFNPISVTVTFDIEGTTSEQTINQGQVVAAPTPAPTKQYHTFTGWYLELNADGTGKGDAFDFDTAVIDAFTLYAGFNPIPVGVTFMVGDDVFDTQTINMGNVATAPLVNPKKATFVFSGWYLEVESDGTPVGNAYDFTDIVTEELTLYAVFVQAQSFDVVYNATTRPVFQSSYEGSELEPSGILSAVKFDSYFVTTLEIDTSGFELQMPMGMTMSSIIGMVKTSANLIYTGQTHSYYEFNFAGMPAMGIPSAFMTLKDYGDCINLEVFIDSMGINVAYVANNTTVADDKIALTYCYVGFDTYVVIERGTEKNTYLVTGMEEVSADTVFDQDKMDLYVNDDLVIIDAPQSAVKDGYLELSFNVNHPNSGYFESIIADKDDAINLTKYNISGYTTTVTYRGFAEVNALNEGIDTDDMYDLASALYEEAIVVWQEIVDGIRESYEGFEFEGTTYYVSEQGGLIKVSDYDGLELSYNNGEIAYATIYNDNGFYFISADGKVYVEGNKVLSGTTFPVEQFELFEKFYMSYVYIVVNYV